MKQYESMFFIISIVAIAFTGCSINTMAVNMVADMLSGEDSMVFTGDEDPVLVGESLPFALKLYESLLEANPDNKSLLLATTKAFCLYAFAYVQTPAEMLPDDEYEKQQEMMMRAKKLFLRARGYSLHAFFLQNPQWVTSIEANELEKAFSTITEKDLPYLYWTGTSWMAAVSVDPFDVSLMVTLPVAVQCLEKVVALDDDYDKGGAHELLLTYYGSLPEEMGGGEEKARYHYRKALEYCDNKKAGPHLALATSVCINSQNRDEFNGLLEKVFTIDVSEPSEFRLFNILNQQKAMWYSIHIEDFFI